METMPCCRSHGDQQPPLNVSKFHMTRIHQMWSTYQRYQVSEIQLWQQIWARSNLYWTVSISIGTIESSALICFGGLECLGIQEFQITSHQPPTITTNAGQLENANEPPCVSAPSNKQPQQYKLSSCVVIKHAKKQWSIDNPTANQLAR